MGNQKAVLSWREDGKRQEVNPLIFGHFIEFMRDCIDEGMWAQLLKNRGFEQAEEERCGVADGWCRRSRKDAYAYEQDWTDSISKEGCSQKLTCRNHYDGYVGVAQERLYLEKQGYRGYIWMKGSGPLPVELLVRDLEGREYHHESFTVTGQWEKYEFSFDSAHVTYDGILEIRLTDDGSLWLDSASLMPEDTAGGIWKEVYQYIQALNPAVIRFPGGCFADCYHWEDGIGERDRRPVRKNLHWGGYEDQSFGTDEYMEFCRTIGCEPMICVNFGSGTPEEAANWVEYCNGPADSRYGRIRAENGHPKPYGIRYWDIGNETFGEWEIGHCDAAAYAEKYLRFYEAMREKDPTIVFMTCGGDGDSRSQEWNRQIAAVIGDRMDAVCLHMYAQKAIEVSMDSREIYYATVGAVCKYEEILQASYDTVRRGGSPNARAAVTEYNVGTITDTYREQTLEAALFNAGMLNAFIRHSEKLVMCNLSDLVNGWPGGCIVSKNGHAFGTATYHVLALYAGSCIRERRDSQCDSPSYDTVRAAGNIEPLTGVPYVDAVVCVDQDGEDLIFAVNRSCDEEAGLVIDCGRRIQKAVCTVITSEKTSDMNSWQDERIRPVTVEKEVIENTISLPPHSVSRIRLLWQ